MKTKEKMKETVVRVLERESEGYIYTYKLTVAESRRLSSFGVPLYSVNITMSGIEMGTTSATAREIFSDAGAAIDFFEKAARNLVTPIDLPYVIEDELGK